MFLRLLIVICITGYGYSCPFDEAVNKRVNIPKVFLNYRHDRSRRDVNLYYPMRFHVHMDKIESADAGKIKSILKAATASISQFLHVIPVHGPLLLERTSCGSTWSHGPNRGRCSSLRAKSMEFCGNRIDNFKIPDEHLDKLDVYNFVDSNPAYSIRPGPGAVASDYILYISSHFSPWCQLRDIKAYSSYCRLDQYGRPVAGFINLCPGTLEKIFYHLDDFIKMAIHEILHVLGFSKDLFPLYNGCPLDEPYCEKPKNVVIWGPDNVPRLTFRGVIKETRTHFGCENPDFGAPLEVVDTTYTSHWDPLIMYASIMSPSIQDNDFALIDPITLSVFASSGWYHVNFSHSDTYSWGKGEGCDFGLRAECNSREEFCKVDSTAGNHSVVGCDFLHFTQTSCQKLQPNHRCGIFKPDAQNDCRKQELNIEGRSMKDLRCFVTQKGSDVSTMCTAFSCKNDGELAVLMNKMWITCPYNSVVNVDNELLICPKADIFCHTASAYHDPNAAQKSSSSIIMIITFTVFAAIWIIVCDQKM